MNERILHDMRRRIEERYGSLASPRFSFVREAMAANPYASVVRRIEERFACEEDTDPNDDVSFGYVLRDPSGVWVLRLSMIGPYAVLMRQRRDGSVEVVAPGTAVASESERQLMHLLADAGVVVVDRRTLLEPVQLALSNTEPNRVRVYQALFTDTDVLPWEPAA